MVETMSATSGDPRTLGATSEVEAEVHPAPRVLCTRSIRGRADTLRLEDIQVLVCTCDLTGRVTARNCAGNCFHKKRKIEVKEEAMIEKRTMFDLLFKTPLSFPHIPQLAQLRLSPSDVNAHDQV